MTIAALWWSSSSFGVGLGLGEVNVVSSLSVPFKASITLDGMEAVNLDPKQFSIRIDGETGANIDYRLERVDADTALIHLYTREAISEPVIQFRVEVTWERNTVTRSYDVFVDPPAYQEHFTGAEASADDRSTAAEQASETMLPATQMSPIALGEAAASTTQVDEMQTIEAAIDEPVAGDSVVEPGESRREYGPTIDGNSIWRVARAVATDASDLTIYQWMYAIWKANPWAFTGKNMHRLNMGEVLAIPLEDEVRERSHAEAWRAYTSQQALLQAVDPVTGESAPQAGVAAARQAEAQSAETSLVEVTGAPVGKLKQLDESAADNPAMAASVDESTVKPVNATAKEDALVALLEESASAMDERAIVSAHPAGAGESALAETTPLMESGEIVEAMTTPAVEMPDAATMDASANPPVMPGKVILDDIEGADLEPVAAIDQSARELALIPAADQVGDRTDASANVISEVPVVDWYESLQSRQRFIETMPVIGAAGSLAFIGHAVQRTDAFIATSPSWAALAFGAWVSLVIVMLRNELLRRRQQRASAAVIPVAANNVTRAGATGRFSPSPAVGKESAGKSRSRQLPEQPPSESNARAIIAQADSILAGGDVEETIKLMKLAVELQPNQPMLVRRLLELYHQTRRADDFARVLYESLGVLQNLNSDDMDELQRMHFRLLPGSVFPLVQVPAVNSKAASEKNPGASQRDDMPLFAEPGAVEGNPALDDESDQNVMEAGVSEDFGRRFDALAADSHRKPEDRDFIRTQVIYSDGGVPLREEAVEKQTRAGEFPDLGVALKEADVYLAYGLYDNAEELLLKGMEVDPNRADFLARLLDVYYATGNLVDFVSCAEVMLDMGDEGREYWEKVEIMGYELAPYNKLFAGGKDRSLDDIELAIPRPETADFDFSDIEGEFAADIEIDIEEEAEAIAAELNLDLSTSEYEDTADRLDQILSLDSSETPSIPATPRHFDDDDISDFVIADDDEVDIGAGEGAPMRSLRTSELLAIPDTSEDSSQEDISAVDSESANELDDLAEELDQLPSLDRSEILAIPETSARSDSEDNEAFEIDEDGLAIDLEAVSEDLELDFDGESVDDGDDPEPESDDEEVMKFTIEDTRPEQAASLDTGETGLSVVASSSADALANPSGEKVDGRILYFSENNKEGNAISEFESEVKVTLQTIRDQLQHITERLFRQERETSDVKQRIAELGRDETVSAKKKNKKSS